MPAAQRTTYLQALVGNLVRPPLLLSRHAVERESTSEGACVRERATGGGAPPVKRSRIFRGPFAEKPEAFLQLQSPLLALLVHFGTHFAAPRFSRREAQTLVHTLAETLVEFDHFSTTQLLPQFISVTLQRGKVPRKGQQSKCPWLGASPRSLV
jgi:hypothetical protein